MRKVLITLAAVLAMSPRLAAAAEPAIPDVVDARQASPEVAAYFKDFFATKTRKDLGRTMSFFSPDLKTYTDATLGWDLSGFKQLEGVFAEYMPKWPDTAKSYPTRILGDSTSALVEFTDTPELFGGELRILGAVDMIDGKVVRWVDYWDASGFDGDLYRKIRTPAENFPLEFREKQLGERASGALRATAGKLQAAFAVADASAAAELFSYDAIYEDAALRTQIRGREAIRRYLSRVLPTVPYGRGSSLRHVVGSGSGGGFEWTATEDRGARVGISALTLAQDGMITGLTTVYDSRQMAPEAVKTLSGLAIEPN